MYHYMENNLAYYQQFYGFLNQIIDLSEEMIEDIETYFHIKKIEQGDIVLSEGDALNEVGFVCEGLFRYYYLDYNGNEHTKYFCDENDFLMSFKAFREGKVSFYIEAIEPSILLSIKVNELKDLIGCDMNWFLVYTFLLEKSYITKEDREADFLLFQATERYMKFKKSYPKLVGRVQQQHMASYLGISPVSLSRIKNTMTE